MNDFKINLFYKNDSESLQELMKRVFINYVKQSIESDGLQN